MALVPGTRVGAYEILSALGAGGMGEVYRGRDTRLDRPVAIKVLKPGSDPERFLREARVAANVRSPHAVSVFDYHVLDDGQPMIVMELIDGHSLAHEIQLRGALDEGDLVRYMKHAALGMAAAAECGVVHRDLKPANLLLERSGSLLVADFGLARQQASSVDLDTTTLTDAGTIFGTPLYMAPEQAENPRSADVRSDVYSYGATFYHAATGRPPFEGPGALAILLKHKLETPAAPIARRSQIPQRLNDVIERCLAKSPDDRFQTFEDLSGALLDPSLSAWNESFNPRVQRVMEQYLHERNSFWNDGGAARELARYDFPNGRSLRIILGNIADAVADGIVSSDDEKVSMGGGVSNALNRASGFALAEEVRKYRPVRHGGVIATPAGQLRAKFVLHGITIDRSSEHVLTPSRDILRQIMAGCFYHANTLALTSLAFPLLGTGTAGFPPETCLDTMMAYLIDKLMNGAHLVQRVDVVLYWLTQPKAFMSVSDSKDTTRPLV